MRQTNGLLRWVANSALCLGTWGMGLGCEGISAEPAEGVDVERPAQLQAAKGDGPGQGSCAGRCGSAASGLGCYCDAACVDFGDCCADLETVCPDPGDSCAGRCGGKSASGACYCDAQCSDSGDCCGDKADVCPRELTLASDGHNGLEPAYFGNGRAAMTRIAGSTYYATAGSVGGAGIQLYRAPVGSRKFTDVTDTKLPEEAGRARVTGTPSFGDLNADGFDDLLFVRDEEPYAQVLGFLYAPATQRFQALPFNTNQVVSNNQYHRGYAATGDEVASFFGSTPLGDKTTRAVFADVDGDGDQDIFLARTGVNIVLENLSHNAPAWDATSPNQQRFARHYVDRNDAVHDGALTEVALAANVVKTWGGTEIVAADTICDPARAGGCPANPNRFIHVYGLAPTALACPVAGNQVCEVGEANGPDCAPAGSLPLSCKFRDRLRRPTLVSATAAVVAPVVGSPTPDILVFGGPYDAATAGTFAGCFTDAGAPACDADLHSFGQKRVVPIEENGSFGPDVLAPAPFGGELYRHVMSAVTANLGGGGPSIVTYSPTTRSPGSAETPLSVVRTAPALAPVACAGLLRDDYAVADGTLVASALDGDGFDDIHLFVGVNNRTYFSTGGTGCLRLDHKVPVTGQNLSRPVVADFDADGRPDVFIGTWADTVHDSPAPKLYLQDASGRFVDRSGLIPPHPASVEAADGRLLEGIAPYFFIGAAVALDVDGDGDQDILATSQGPMLLYRNRRVPSGAVGFELAQDLLPPYYTYGGAINGRNPAYASCTDRSAEGDPLDPRCHARSLAVGDFDRNGSQDVALGLRKGRNDVLFNNLSGGCGNGWWCARPGFLSARDDLRLPKVFPSLTEGANATGSGNSNRTQFLRAAYFDDPGAAKRTLDIVAIAAPASTFQGAYDQLFKNGITAAYPHGKPCTLPTTGADCGAGRTCASVNGQPEALVCHWNGAAESVGGWFNAVPNAIPTRDDGATASRYYSASCAAVGDLNRDGYLDLLVATQAVESTPDLTGAPALDGGCRLMRPVDLDGDGVIEDDDDPATPQVDEVPAPLCDKAAVCTPWRCSATNPDGLQGLATFDEDRAECCTVVDTGNDLATQAFFEPPACADAAKNRNDPDWCMVSGFSSSTLAGEARIFAYLYDAATGRFVKKAQPVAMSDAESRRSLYMDCAIGDVNNDGHNDFVVAGYTTGDMPESYALANLPLLTDPAGWHRRRHRAVQPTRLWLNPGWGAPALGMLAPQPFAAGRLERRADKVYSVVLADIDRDNKLEVLTSGGFRLDVLDD